MSELRPAVDAGYHLCTSWTCVFDWLGGQPGNNFVTALGAAATFAVALQAYRFSTREARQRQIEAIFHARIVAAQATGTIERWQRLAYRLSGAVHGISKARGRSIEAARASYEEFASLIQEPMHWNPELPLQLAPLGNGVAGDLSIALGLLQKSLNAGPVTKSYVGRLEADKLDPHEWSFDGLGEDLSAVIDRLKRVHDKLNLVLYHHQPGDWAPPFEAPTLTAFPDVFMPVMLRRHFRWLGRWVARINERQAAKGKTPFLLYGPLGWRWSRSYALWWIQWRTQRRQRNQRR